MVNWEIPWVFFMILGFFLVDVSGFISFEHYTNDLMGNLPSTKAEFFKFLDDTNYEIGIHTYQDKIISEVIELNEKANLGLVFLKTRPITEEIRLRMKEIGGKVSVGDKFTIHNILQAQSPSDILF